MSSSLAGRKYTGSLFSVFSLRLQNVKSQHAAIIINWLQAGVTYCDKYAPQKQYCSYKFVIKGNRRPDYGRIARRRRNKLLRRKLLRRNVGIESVLSGCMGDTAYGTRETKLFSDRYVVSVRDGPVT